MIRKQKRFETFGYTVTYFIPVTVIVFIYSTVYTQRKVVCRINLMCYVPLARCVLNAILYIEAG